MALTEKYTSDNSQPGDYYKAIWCRDAAYILKDQFLSGHRKNVLRQIMDIWKNQIGQNFCKVVYGRGSPQTEFNPLVADDRRIKSFSGALPTTIFDGFCEVYGQSPDIDSTALMMYVTSWVMARLLLRSKETKLNLQISPEEISSSISYLVPFLLRAQEYLQSRDIDKDGLLEQECNEDWMDTVLRKGKIVYSQAVWLMALKSLNLFLTLLKEEEKASELESTSQKLTRSIEEKMWSQSKNCFLDIDSETVSEDNSSKVRYQDAVFYILALTEPSRIDLLSHEVSDLQVFETLTEKSRSRIESMLKQLKESNWHGMWPLLSDKALVKTGPWILKQHEYHNHTYWPWITAMELIARLRCGKKNDCEAMLSNLLTKSGPEKNHDYIFYEWLNPKTLEGGGAYPFRTGISSFRLAIHEVLAANQGNGNQIIELGSRRRDHD